MKNRSVPDAFKHAWDGVRRALTDERNFKIHLALAACAILACVLLRVEAVYFCAVIFAVFFVLAMELVNTAVEALTDLICGEKRHPLAKTAKDTAAAAVLLAAHGLMHLLGYDHENEADEKKMVAEQEAILNALGIPR